MHVTQRTKRRAAARRAGPLVDETVTTDGTLDGDAALAWYANVVNGSNTGSGSLAERPSRGRRSVAGAGASVSVACR